MRSTICTDGYSGTCENRSNQPRTQFLGPQTAVIQTLTAITFAMLVRSSSTNLTVQALHVQYTGEIWHKAYAHNRKECMESPPRRRSHDVGRLLLNCMQWLMISLLVEKNSEHTLCLKKTGTPLKLIVSRIQVHKIRRIFYKKNCKPIRRKSWNF